MQSLQNTKQKSASTLQSWLRPGVAWEANTTFGMGNDFTLDKGQIKQSEKILRS
jgi:hypothetical protein